jgi:hypothetical protein
MLEFRKPIPVIIKHLNEEGYALYCESGGLLENDVWTVVHCKGGIIRHYTTEQLLIYKNGTYEITENKKDLE